jgi:hypothetical protein
MNNDKRDPKAETETPKTEKKVPFFAGEVGNKPMTVRSNLHAGQESRVK